MVSSQVGGGCSASELWLREQVCDLPVLREPAGGLLRIEELAVAGDVEDATAAANQLDVRLRVDLENRSLQTGSVGQVVSGAAVEDGDFHGPMLAQVAPAGGRGHRDRGLLLI